MMDLSLRKIKPARSHQLCYLSHCREMPQLYIFFVALLTFELSTFQDLRVAALRYLTKLPEIVRYDVLHPQKKDVIRGLGKALDDSRRAVRQEAANARTAW